MLRCAFALFFAIPLFAEDWPEFRGPTGEGHSSEQGVPLTWSEKEHVKWKVPIAGRGWSSPSILGDRIWLTTAAEEGKSLRAICLDRETGKIIHNIEVFRINDPGSINPKNSHASPTPVLEGDRVYLHFGGHGTACLRQSGEILWKTKLDYAHLHGPGGSPVLYQDLLIVSCDGEDKQFVAALDKMTGKVRWNRPRADGYQSYTTPLILRLPGGDQVLSIGAHRAVSYEPKTGKELWWVRYGRGYSNVPRPVFGQGIVFICTGWDRPILLAVRPDGKGDVTDTHVAWSSTRSIPYTPSPLIVGEELYIVSDNGIAACLDVKTGKEHWRERLGGNFSASPLFADGRIYFSSEEGETTVLAPGKLFKKLAVNTVDGSTLASIAVSRGSFFIRSATHLYRVQ